MGGAVIAEPTVLPLRGELCIAELPDVRALIEAAVTAGAVMLTIDLAEVTLLTAGALRVFATTEHRLVARGGALRLRNPTPLARRVLEIAGFEHLLGPVLQA
ncbi:MAG: hypothetical protein QOD30_964 [Actinomycetota bacterium]|jgi:anti-anti-sigma factor|nr:hypothetical protein [Actinomycetota bacterium]